MLSYIEEFIERQSNKSFVTNLKKYNTLNWYGKMKCISSFMTHLIIDAENNIENAGIQEEVLSILMKMVLYKEDSFIEWLQTKIDAEN